MKIMPYYSSVLDYELALQHEDWRVVGRDGKPVPAEISLPAYIVPMNGSKWAASFGNASSAQGGARPGGSPQPGGNIITTLFKNITLTAEQQTKVNTVWAEHLKQLADLPQAKPGKPQPERHRIAVQTFDKFRVVLTKEQRATFDANRKALESKARR